MDAVDRFDTERLLAERLRATDYADLCRMNQNPRVMETIGGLRSDETTREYLRKTAMSATLCMPDYPTCFIEYVVECVCAFEWKPKQTVRRFTP